MRQIDPQMHLERMWRLAPEYAQAKANRIHLEEYTRSLKATLMKSSGVDAIGAQEREAYAHPDYRAHLEGIKAAVQEEEVLRWRLESARAAIDVWRSMNASNRMIDRSAA